MPEMHYRRMGRSGLKLSALALDTLWFGNRVDEPTACQIVDRALAAGANRHDTADVNGKDRWDTPERGPSEEIVGRALKGRRGGLRHRLRITGLPRAQREDLGARRAPTKGVLTSW